MFLEIEPMSPTPIYTQLINQIKKSIVKGELKTGEMLPSVRSLAGDLGVNMHTVNKGYNLLVDEGILVKSQRGYMVEITKKVSDNIEVELQEKIKDLLVEVFIRDISNEKVKQWTKSIAEDLKREW